MKDTTASWLRDRLFEALDKVIAKEISSKEVESICFVSEQIIKTARVELETAQEFNSEKERARKHEILLIKENNQSLALIENTIDMIGVEDE
jgi:hypothetical protein